MAGRGDAGSGRLVLCFVYGIRDADVEKAFKDRYFRCLANRRGTRLLIGLRRYKNEHGRWPGSLGDIKGTVPDEAFVDPRNGGAFVYRLKGDDFELYSAGPNKIDEGGRYKSGADDWRIWPTHIIRHTMEKHDANE